MNLTRIVVFCVALVAAGAAVLVMRGMLGGGTPAVQASVPPPPTTADVLVAAKDIAAGSSLQVNSVRWESWPKTSVSDSLIVKTTESEIDKVVEGVVVRVPLVAGQPITENAIVRAGASGFMAANLSPGTRAVSIPLSEENGAGGFILPNDRVDVILTRDFSQGSGPKVVVAQTILRDVRVLAIGQTAEAKDSQSLSGKTATVELTPDQSELIEQARLAGTLSLTLRPLGDGGDETTRVSRDTGIFVLRYGIARNGGGQGRVQ